MKEQEVLKGIVMDQNITLTFIEVCQYFQLSQEDLSNWIAHGLLGDEVRVTEERTHFNHNMIRRVRIAHRLHQDLEINTQGVVLALELLDQITAMQEELNILKRM